MASLLADLTIVVTRPAHQAMALQQNLHDQGAQAILFPCIEIKPVSVNKLDVALNEVDILIFISPNAVEYGLKALPNMLNLSSTGAQFAAVGEATAQALLDRDIETVITPNKRFDSEGLLDTQLLQNVQNKTILIVKGIGGRTILKETLTERGANVHSIDVYQRELPENPDTSALIRQVDLILFTSSQSAVNFLALAPVEQFDQLFKSQTIVGHPKIGQKVSSLGFKKLPIIASSPSDRDILDAITQWAQKV